MTANLASAVSDLAPPAAPAAAGRALWVDYARGVGIFLMVVGHVWRGLDEAGLHIPRPVFTFVDLSFYSFHMPMFFFLSGLFAARSIRKPAAQFLADKLATILYPYLLWSLLQGSINVVLSRYTNEHLTFGQLLYDVALAPYSVFWFLYVLFAYMLALLALSRLRVPALGIVVISAAAYCCQLFMPKDRWFPLDDLCRFFIFFAFGAWASGAALEIARRLSAPALAALAAAAVVPYFLSVYHQFFHHVLLFPIAAALGSAVVLPICMLMARGGWMKWWAMLGVYSLAIYCAHVLAMAAVRIGLMHVLHVRSVPIHLLLGTAAGMLFPLALVWAGLSFLFRFPAPVRRPQPAAVGMPTVGQTPPR